MKADKQSREIAAELHAARAQYEACVAQAERLFGVGAPEAIIGLIESRQRLDSARFEAERDRIDDSLGVQP